MSKVKSKVTLYEIGTALREYLTSVADDLIEAKEAGLDEAATFMKEKLEQATPIRTVNSVGTNKKWKVERKYRGVRYVFNTSTAKDGIPIVNLLEYSKNGKPFVRSTFAENENKVISIIKNRVEKGVE